MYSCAIMYIPKQLTPLYYFLDNKSNGECVTDAKLSFFLDDFVTTRGCKLKKNADGTAIPLGKESVLSYVKAVSDLYTIQKALCWNPNGVARDPLLVRAFIGTLKKNELRVKEMHLKTEARTL